MPTQQLIRIDASSMGDLHCFLKFYRRVVLQVTVPKEKIDMSFGSAWHIFREVLAQSGSANTAINKALAYYNPVYNGGEVLIPETKAHLNPAYLVQLCMKYVEQYGETDAARDFQYFRDENGVPRVEQTFSIQIYEDEYVRILLQGTIDEIGKFKNGGCVAFGDDKTTGSYDMEHYLSQHEMKNQLLTYCYALKRIARTAEDTLYKKLFEGRVGGFINGVFLKKDISKVVFKRSNIYYFSDELLDEYERMLMVLCEKLSYAVQMNGANIYREGILNNTCGGNYGDCVYTPVCRQSSKETATRILESQFKHKPYTPLAFRKADVKS